MLVYLHGLGCAGSRDWPPVAGSPSLAGRASLWLDLLGFGSSPRPAGIGYDLDEQAAAVAGTLAAEAAPLALVGHSMGGSLAVMVAERLVAVGRPPVAVVLAEPNLRPEDATTSARVAALPEAAFVAAWPRFVAGVESAWYRGSLRLADPVAYHRNAVSLVAHGRAMLPRFVALPVARKAYVLGGRSDAATHETARLAALAGIEVVTVARSGHEFSADDPAGLAAAIAGAVPARTATARSGAEWSGRTG
ncbi:MAG: alpha/beta hydrolase [Acidobacteria bacterium]|nr:alpha/beta hydrolase [Acidobacteriota bacterium]